MKNPFLKVNLHIFLYVITLGLVNDTTRDTLTLGILEYRDFNLFTVT